MGKKDLGISPRCNSPARKSAKLRPMRAVVSPISLNPPVSSGALLFTMATIFCGFTFTTGAPMRSDGRNSGMGLR